jgi:thymidylate synthase (FAD)
MKVKLVSYSQPSEEYSNAIVGDAQELVAYCARVSNPVNKFNTETAEELIKHMIRMRHWGPLEMVSACLEITTTRDISRQMCRHRSFSFEETCAHLWWSFENEDNTIPALNFHVRKALIQDTVGEDRSLEVEPSTPEEKEICRQWEEKQQAIIAASREAYIWAVQNGIAKSQIRAILPEGNTESQLLMNGTLRSWIHYIELRAAPYGQRDHTLVAKACAEAIAKIFPLAPTFVYS